MASLTKLVNINAPVAIRNITPPIYGTCNNIVMTTGDILKCICKRAKVDEILPDGSIVRLNMRNYYTDNGAGLDGNKTLKIINEKNNKVPEAPSKEAQVVETKTEDNNTEAVKETPVTLDDNLESVTDEMFVTGLVSMDEVSNNDVESTTTSTGGSDVVEVVTSIDSSEAATNSTTTTTSTTKKSTTRKKKTN